MLNNDIVMKDAMCGSVHSSCKCTIFAILKKLSFISLFVLLVLGSFASTGVRYINKEVTGDAIDRSYKTPAGELEGSTVYFSASQHASRNVTPDAGSFSVQEESLIATISSIARTTASQVFAKCYLLYIYPFHNFW